MSVRDAARFARAAAGTVVACALALATVAGADVTYSGRAYGARVVLVNPQPNVLVFSDTGALPPSGGSLSATLLSILLGNTLSSHTITASTSGTGGIATSSAHQEMVVAFAGQPAQVTADVVEAHSQATCSGVQGSSVVTHLTFGGTAVTVTGQPNQTVTIANVATLVINEQIVAPGARDITVNALHLYLGTGEEVILSSAHSDVACPTPARDMTWGRIKTVYR
jgi:hypothetical protein